MSSVEESQSARGTLAGVRTLVVEDHPDTLQLLEAVLVSSGTEVSVARSVKEARAILQKQPVDVMISDVSMAGEDEYALIRSIRATETGARRLLAIALTALARDENRAEALAAGFDVYVRKPVDPGELIALIVRSAARPSREARNR
jgi:CheY-like chemotaxis protein